MNTLYVYRCLHVDIYTQINLVNRPEITDTKRTYLMKQIERYSRLLRGCYVMDYTPNQPLYHETSNIQT